MAESWWAGLAIVLAVIVGAGCGDGGDAGDAGDSSDDRRPPASEQPRDEEIRETIDAVWGATGVDRSQVHVASYDYTFAPDNTACADLDRDDRWFGGRGSSIPPGLVDQPAVEAAIVGFLEAEGFAVERYRSTHPDSRLRAYRAVRDDLVVDGNLNIDGATNVNVRSGPCAPSFGRFDPDLYELDA